MKSFLAGFVQELHTLLTNLLPDLVSRVVLSMKWTCDAQQWSNLTMPPLAMDAQEFLQEEIRHSCIPRFRIHVRHGR